MSKFLVQSKSFLPMVIQKSTTDMVKPALDNNALFVAKLPKPNVESKPENPNVILTQSSSDNLKDWLRGNPQDIRAPSAQQAKTVHHVQTVQQNPPLQQFNSKNICQLKSNKMNSSARLTLFAALKLDFGSVQEHLAEWITRGHMWLFRRRLGLLRTLQVRDSSELGPREGLVWLEGKTRLKEEEPVPVILPEKLKRKPTHVTKADKSKEDVYKKESKSKDPFKSNFLETVQEKAPEWQVAISNRLGALQKTVVRKLSDRKK